MDQDKEREKVERNLVQDCLSWETNGEKNRRVQVQQPGQGSLSGESDVAGKIPDEKQDLENKVLSGEIRWMRRRHRIDLEEGTCSIADLSIADQKICMTDNGYNQVLVMIDHFTKYAEAVPCITASAEETCDHLINTWIARHGCPMTFQSDNGTAFVGELTKELMRRSQVAQAHSRV